jgi:cysteine desulfurase family protein (TIGR01976 family)
MTTLDMERVRAAFPALAGEWAFFDNAGGSQVLGAVADRVRDYLITTSVQTGASYAVSQQAGDRLAQARAAIARLINASRPEEVVLGPSTTVLMRFLGLAMAQRFQPGDEIVLTNFDHESNIGPWLALAAQGVVFRTWTIDPTSHEIDLADLAALLTARTRLVCVTHCSNILGTIHPIRAIADLVHAHGAELCVDGVAYAPHRAVDVQAFAADYYIFSFYKTYGPHLAVMYGRYDKLLDLDGLYHYFYGRHLVPTKLEPGNSNYELTWGCAGIVDYLEMLGGGGGGRAAIAHAFEAIAAQEEALGERLLAYLRTRNDVTIVGRREAGRADRVPTIAFKAAGRDQSEIVRSIDAHRIGIRHGDFHSRRLVEALGLFDRGGVLRVSMVHYNTLQEVDRLVRALDEALGSSRH